MISFPTSAEHQEAHTQAWRRLLSALGETESTSVLNLLWAFANDDRHSLGVRGAVWVDFTQPPAVTLLFQNRQAWAVTIRQDEPERRDNLLKTIDAYDLAQQLVVVVVYSTPIPGTSWVDIFCLDVLMMGLGGGTI